MTLFGNLPFFIGGIFDMIMREEGNNTDGDLSEDSQDASDLLPQHRNELDKNIRKVNLT